MKEHVDVLRRFNRSFTQRIGVLDDHFLGLDRALGQARLLFEIGPGGATVVGLRSRLGLDSGYMSRLLRALEADGLIQVATDPQDRRRRIATLTAEGRREYDELDRRSDELAAGLLAPLTPSQLDRLDDAITTVDRLLRVASARFDIVDPERPDAAWALGRYFAYLDATFPSGFDPGDTDADAAALRPPTGAFVLATIDDETVACGGCQTLEPGVGEVKRMWVADQWRGLGLGRRMVGELERIAGDLGHHTARLDTNATLGPAIAMYRALGYRDIDRYNDNPYAQHWFEKRLAR